MSTFSSPFAESMKAFLDYRAALGYARTHNQEVLANLDRFIVAEYPAATELTNDLVMRWVGAQTGNLGQKTSSIRMYAEYLLSTGANAYVLPRKAIARTSSPSNRYSETAHMFTDDELSRLFRAIDTIPQDRREPMLSIIFPVMIRLTYTCGLRPNESRVLKCSRINFETSTILITETKGNKERIVVMSPAMLERCKEYDTKRALFSHGSEYFFPTWNGGAFEPRAVQRYFRECWERANPGIDKNMLPSVRVYDLRHRFATAALIRWLNNGAELGAKLAYLQAYMGHDNINETLYYVHILPENLVQSSGINWHDFDDIVPEVVEW